jgi:hypothetical protein
MRDHAGHTRLFCHKTAHSGHDIPSEGVLDESFLEDSGDLAENLNISDLSSITKHRGIAVT